MMSVSVALALQGCENNMTKMWTKSEAEILERFYCDHGPRWTGWKVVLPGRSVEEIRKYAIIHKIRQRPHKRQLREKEKLYKSDILSLKIRCDRLTSSAHESGRSVETAKNELIKMADWLHMPPVILAARLMSEMCAQELKCWK